MRKDSQRGPAKTLAELNSAHRHWQAKSQYKLVTLNVLHRPLALRGHVTSFL